MIGPRSIFKKEVLRRLENVMFNLIRANNRVILVVFYVKFKECFLDILSYFESSIRSTQIGLEKTLKIEDLILLDSGGGTRNSPAGG